MQHKRHQEELLQHDPLHHRMCDKHLRAEVLLLLPIKEEVAIHKGVRLQDHQDLAIARLQGLQDLHIVRPRQVEVVAAVALHQATQHLQEAVRHLALLHEAAALAVVLLEEVEDSYNHKRDK